MTINPGRDHQPNLGNFFIAVLWWPTHLPRRALTLSVFAMALWSNKIRELLQGATTFGSHISHIVGVTTNEQVCWVATNLIIAPMQHVGVAESATHPSWIVDQAGQIGGDPVRSELSTC